MKVRILRAMCFGGERKEAGSVLDVADLLARELVAQGRAERTDGAVKAPSGPMTTETAAAVVKGKAAKESMDAG